LELFVTNPDIELGEAVGPGDRLGTLYYSTYLKKIQDNVPDERESCTISGRVGP
jgi:hypothetical protein